VVKRRVMAKPKARQRGGASVPCPQCQAVPTKVLQTRRDDNLTVWRQRICPHCQTRFNTTEGQNANTAAPWSTANERAALTA
jgi:transcriptional regulator NrdR family protein